MSVRYYSTTVEPEQSLAEVAALLRKYGAQRFEQLWTDEGKTYAIRFNLPSGSEYLGHINVVLRPKVETLSETLRKKHGIRDPDQVLRVAWRQLKGILEGILMAVDSGMFTAPELFLGMAESNSGESLYDVLLANPEILMLTSGGDS